MAAFTLAATSGLKDMQSRTLDTARAVLRGAPVPYGRAPYAPGSSERALEVVYAAQHLRTSQRVLDLGLTFASLDYLGFVLGLIQGGVAVEGVDIIPPARVLGRYPADWRDAVLNVPLHLGDVRVLDLPHASYDVCTCVSTLEHIGFDEASDTKDTAFKRGETPEAAPAHRAADTDARVLHAIAGALKPRGSLILTVPAGQGGPVLLQDSLGLYTRQWEYEAQSLAALMSHPAFVLEDQQFYRETPQGWVQVAGIGDLADVTSALKPHAAGCVMMVLRKR